MTVKIGNTKGNENKMDIVMDSLTHTIPGNNIEIGNVIGNNNKASLVVGQGKPKRLRPIWLIAGIILAAINSIASNILSSYIYDKYGIFTQNIRLVIVVFVFIITLVFASWLAVRDSK